MTTLLALLQAMFGRRWQHTEPKPPEVKADPDEERISQVLRAHTALYNVQELVDPTTRQMIADLLPRLTLAGQILAARDHGADT